VTSRTVNANDGTGGHTWTYGYGTNSAGAETTTVTDPVGNYSVHTFGLSIGQPIYETQVQYFQANGTLLKTVNTTYSYTASNMSRNSQAPLNVVPIQITVTLANGKTSTVNRSYDSGFNYVDFTGSSTGGDNSTPNVGIYGRELSESASDYGNNSAGPTLRTTNTSYLALSNSNYLAANLLNLVSSKSVSDGRGCRMAETDYTYDESNYLTSYTGTLPTGTHGAPPNSVRGNPTTVTQEQFSAGTCPTTTQSGPASHTDWYDTGEVYQAIDALGNTTTHNYDPAYGGAYSTSTTNALNQSVSGAYDFNTGSLSSFTDANGNSTTYGFDSMGRVTSIVFPKDASGNQPQTLFKYSPASSGFPLTVQRLKSVTPAMPDSVTTTLDGLGRTSQTQHATPNGNATVVTTYDGAGRVATVTNPYFTTSDSTYGVTSTQYDGLGRVTQVTKQDGSINTAQYDQSSTTSPNADCTIGTDEAGNQRQSCSDGMGRLIEVDEPGNAFAGTQASGSIPVDGSLQSTVVGAHGAVAATGSITISGGEQSKTITLYNQPCPGRPTQHTCTITIIYYDHGTVTVSVNGTAYSSAYTQNFTSSLIAQNIANSMANDPNVSVASITNSGSSSVINLQALNAGQAGNNITIGSSYTYDSSAFSSPSFTTSPTSGNLSGGQDAFAGNTVYDAGTITLTVGGFTSPTVAYGQNSNSTASQVASALAQALSNASGSPATATASGSTINISWNTVGTAGNVSATSTGTTTQTSYFSLPSFAGCQPITTNPQTCSTALSGGQNPYPSGLAHPYLTLYSYDALGNLLSVNQKGDGSQAARVRNFTYDSLSSLLTANNPESGAITYSYDANDNLLQKTSPAPNQTGSATQTISYCYDPLNRVTGNAYSAQTCTNGQLPAGTAVVSYTYDQGTNGIGHMTSLTDQAGSGSYTYDVMGRTASESRTIAGITKSMSYTYNLDSSLNVLTYPSGAAVTYTPWNNGTNAVAGVSQSAIDQGNAVNFVTAANYEADLGVTSFVSGNSSGFAGITNSFSYNKRLQPLSMSASSPSQTVFSVGYDFHAGNGDNGNVYAVTNNRDHSRDQTFTYDTLNRLTSAQNAGTDCTKNTVNSKTEYWGNNYGYDPWSNLVSKSPTKCGGENLPLSADAQNRVHVTVGADYQYDDAGNMTYNASGMYYNYDQENRISGAGGFTYT
jgi:YD repeat-containing protein